MLWIEHADASTKGENGLMVAGSGHGSAAKGSAIDLEVTGSGLISCCFSFPSSFFTMCSSLLCFSYTEGCKSRP